MNKVFFALVMVGVALSAQGKSAQGKYEVKCQSGLILADESMIVGPVINKVLTVNSSADAIGTDLTYVVSLDSRELNGKQQNVFTVNISRQDNAESMDLFPGAETTGSYLGLIAQVPYNGKGALAQIECHIAPQK